MNIEKLNDEEMKKIINNESLRVSLTKGSHIWFFNVYFGHYITYEAANFHREMFALTENENITTLGIVAFRGCAKSTIFTLSYPIWAILGKQQKKFVIILGETQRQAKQHLVNIRKELESNELLKSDLGPFKEIEDEWGSYSLVIPKYNARITAASMEQTIRGMRHNQYRPDLIICDDIEDLNNVRTKEGRDKVYNWITGEVVPAGDHSTRIIFIGNLLHEDSLLMRIKGKIINKELDGYFTEIPLIDNNDNITWPGKFPDMKSVEKEKKKIGDEISWQREYMLKIIPSSERAIHREWIKYYDELPSMERRKFNPIDWRKYAGLTDGGKILLNEQIRQNTLKDNPAVNLAYGYTATGIDLAASQKQSADFTAMVSARVYGSGKGLKIYILPHSINERLTFPEIIRKAKGLSLALGNGFPTKLYVEEAAIQQYVPQQLVADGFPAEGVKIFGDKWFRLHLLSIYIQNGTVIFPKIGAEPLISNLVNFGAEKHDDLADAFSLLINKIISVNLKKGRGFGLAVGDGAGNTIMYSNESGMEIITQDGKRHPYMPIHHA